jgi:hypothetical protein
MHWEYQRPWWSPFTSTTALEAGCAQRMTATPRQKCPCAAAEPKSKLSGTSTLSVKWRVTSSHQRLALLHYFWLPPPPFRTPTPPCFINSSNFLIDIHLKSFQMHSFMLNTQDEQERLKWKTLVSPFRLALGGNLVVGYPRKCVQLVTPIRGKDVLISHLVSTFPSCSNEFNTSSSST